MTERPVRWRGEHPEDGVLSAYYDDELAPAERARVATHLADCGHCRAVVHGYASLGELLREQYVAPPANLAVDLEARLGRRGFWSRFWPRVAAVGSLAAVVVVAYAVLLWRAQGPVAIAMAFPPPQSTSVAVDTAMEIAYSAGVDHTAVEQAVRIEPPVPVTKHWRGDTLVLQPEQPLAPDKTYSVIAPAEAPPAPPPVPPVAQVQQSQPAATPQVVTSFRTAPVAVAAAAPTAPASASVVQSTPVKPAASAQAGQTSVTAALPPTPTPGGAVVVAAAVPTSGPDAMAATKTPPAAVKRPAKGFGILYRQADVAIALSRPVGDEKAVKVVEQQFEHGWLLYRTEQTKGVSPTYYVLTSDGKWRAYADNYSATEPEPTPQVEPPQGLSAPRHELGRLWQAREDVRTELGWAVEVEHPLNGSVQDFVNGSMLGHERKVIYVFYADGRWQRFTDPYVAPTPTPSGTPRATGVAQSGTTNAVDSDCLVVPQGPFAGVWSGNEDLRTRLACALEVETAVQLTQQSFEHGIIVARPDRRVVYVLLADGTWSAYADSYQQAKAGEETVPAGLLAPEGLLGGIWREHPEVRKGLGWATAPEQSSVGAAESFAAGNMLTGSQGVLAIYADGRWELVPRSNPTATPLATPRGTPEATPEVTSAAIASATPSATPQPTPRATPTANVQQH